MIDLPRAYRITFDDAQYGFDGRRGVMNLPPSQQLVKNGPERIDVGRRKAGLPAHRLFRRHVRRRADDCARLRCPWLDCRLPRQSEVGNVRIAITVEEYVRRL